MFLRHWGGFDYFADRDCREVELDGGGRAIFVVPLLGALLDADWGVRGG
jgi:hypothetical protein